MIQSGGSHRLSDSRVDNKSGSAYTGMHTAMSIAASDAGSKAGNARNRLAYFCQWISSRIHCTFVLHCDHTMSCILGNQYIPSVAYFAHWLHHGDILIEAHEHYQKRTWRNKTCILGADKPQSLTVPLQKGKHNRMPITEVQIAYDEDWPTKHLRSMHTAYGKTGFAEEVLAGLEPILHHSYDLLWDLNIACLHYLTELIKGNWRYSLTTQYEANISNPMTDLREGIQCGCPESPLVYPTYHQVLRIGKPHQPNLSILDALCHLGPGTYDYLVRYAQQLYPVA